MLRSVWDALPGRLPGGAARAQEHDPIVGYVRETRAEARREVRRADETAAILLAVTGAAAGGVVAGLLDGRLRPGELPGQVEWLWWAGMFFWLLGLLMLAAALHPRSARLAGRSVERRRSYPGGFTVSSPAGPARDGRGHDARLRLDLVVLDIRSLGAVADAKERYVRRGIVLMLFSLACCVSSVLIGRSL
ncbi:hypothetical protein FHS43_002190 [Streptosporangium becharense]|uniref:Pycsar effector protein domain-containing protein n=1 Tax=Streptosporangium becharense TaxID=1816182 RepID=A0A7W9IK00_9ACTN|nr:Pycsar system effector family protein [Streptosporangium becharense]MBB2910925.1 hypothetical protein [Streptosporangium becharense]MBB5822016.1 hypothetical protein [Streptosporangium becharense]